MSEKILVPVLGESINEATVTKWLKNKGDKVVADEPVVELENVWKVFGARARGHAGDT